MIAEQKYFGGELWIGLDWIDAFALINATMSIRKAKLSNFAVIVRQEFVLIGICAKGVVCCDLGGQSETRCWWRLALL